MKTAPAVLYEAPGKVAVRNLDVPDPGPGQVQIRTEWSVLSPGTEGWVLANTFTWQPTQYPCVPGYQRVGVIEALGDGVSGWSVGERVIATWSDGAHTITPMWGAHAALANTSATEIYPLGDLDPVDAAGFVVAQVGYNAASRLVLESGDWVAVYGDGIIGQCAAQAARARGAKVVMVGHRPERLNRASELGVELTLNPRERSVATALQLATGEGTLTGVIDTIQGLAVQAEFGPLLEHGRGQIVYAGFSSGTAWADMADLQQRELTTHFISGWARHRLEATLGLMRSGQMTVRGLVTHELPFEDSPKAFEMIKTKSEPFLGIALRWETTQ